MGVGRDIEVKVSNFNGVVSDQNAEDSEMIYYDTVFTKEDLDVVRNICEKDQWLIGSKGYNGDRDVLKEGILNPKNAPPFPIIMKKYLDSLHPVQRSYISAFTKNKFLYDAKLARYNVGDQYVWHVDELSLGKLERLISSITYLNDDFKGGTTEFENRTITPKKDHTLIFPSNWAFLHRGTPITEGCKYIMVVHCFVEMNRENVSSTT